MSFGVLIAKDRVHCSSIAHCEAGIAARPRRELAPESGIFHPHYSPRNIVSDGWSASALAYSMPLHPAIRARTGGGWRTPKSHKGPPHLATTPKRVALPKTSDFRRPNGSLITIVA